MRSTRDTRPLSDPGELPPRRTFGLRQRTLRGDAAEAIRAKIVSGEIERNVFHSVAKIAEELGVSATPVREALLDIASDGLIEVVRNRGFRIRELTARDFDEIVRIRMVLEVAAVREITERRLVPDFTDLRLLSAQAEAAAMAGNRVDLIADDRALHLTLLGYLNNPLLVEIVSRLRDQAGLCELDRMVGVHAFLDSAREHRLLLDAVEAGRAAEAAEIMSRHLRHAYGVWARLGERESSSPTLG